MDERETNRMLHSTFLEESFDIAIAENGEDALRHLHNHAMEANVALMDILMPAMGGSL